jgi:hypothetical protein
VVNNRNRVTDADGRGPADHVAAEIIGAGGEAVAEHSDAADPAGGEAIEINLQGSVRLAPGRDGGDAPGGYGRIILVVLDRRAARRRRAVRLRGQQGRAAGVRPVAGGGGRG